MKVKGALILVELLLCLAHGQLQDYAATADSGPVVVQFTKSDCPYCRAIAPAVEKLQREGFDIIVVDTNASPGQAQNYGVEKVPAFLVIEQGFGGSDKILGRKVGGINEQELRKFLGDKGVKPKDPNPKGA